MIKLQRLGLSVQSVQPKARSVDVSIFRLFNFKFQPPGRKIKHDTLNKWVSYTW